MLSIKFHVNQTLFALVTGYYLLQGVWGGMAAGWRHSSPNEAVSNSSLWQAQVTCFAPPFPFLHQHLQLQIVLTSQHSKPSHCCVGIFNGCSLSVSSWSPAHCGSISLPPRISCASLSTPLNLTPSSSPTPLGSLPYHACGTLPSNLDSSLMSVP